MTCAPGQTDLNSATVPQLMQALRVDQPTAKRVVDMRPYLQVSPDLLVINGIGPDRLAQIAASKAACATPQTTPPFSDDHCASSSKVDLQSAGRDELMSRLRITGPIADRIIAGRPYATLRHVTPERTGGVGKGTLDSLVKISCLTPQPIRDSSSSWRWAYPALDTTVARDGYKLNVPKNVVDAPDGAWTRITPATTPTSDLPGPAWPSADFHIEGAWQGGGDTVAVTVPAASYASIYQDDADWQPALLHYNTPDRASGGIVSGSQVTEDPTTHAVSASVDHLSLIDWAREHRSWLATPGDVLAGFFSGNRFPTPTCSNPWSQTPNTSLYVATANEDSAFADLTGGLLNLPGNPIPPLGFIIKHCVGDGETTTVDGRSVAVRLRNNTGSIMKVDHYSGVESHADDSDADAAPGVISSVFTHFATGSRELAGPGDTAKMTVPAGEFGAINMVPDRLRTILNVGSHYALDQVLDRFGGDNGPIIKDPTISEFIVRTLRCEYNTLNGITGGLSFANAARDTTKAIYDCLVKENTLINLTVRIQQMINAGLISGSVADKAQAALTVLRDTQRWLQLGQITVDVVDTVWAFLGTVPITVEHTAGKPTVDAEGRTIFNRCVKLVGLKWKIDENCQNASYTQTSQPLGGGGSTGLPLGKMFRTTTGNAFFVNLETGERHRIDDGGTYLCLAQHYAVDWNANPHTYQSKFPALGDNATCDASIAPTRRIAPGELGALDRVLREADGTAWIIHPDDTREHITSGTEFGCWVSPVYATNIEFDVWDQISAAGIDAYPISPYTTSNCGDPQHPTF